MNEPTEIQPPGYNDVAPSFAISLEEATQRIKTLKEFVRDHMTEGEDFGVIPGTSTKPTLFKPGAEKLNAMFGLAPVVEVITRETDWDKGFVSYEIKVTLLNKRTSNIEAEGVGSCNSRERRYKNQDAANIANTILKMAKKRALIDATLSATRASGVFTQDLEDIEQEPPPQQRPTQAPQRMQQAARNTQPQARPQDNGVGLLTEAQRGAILAIANKVFGRDTKTEMDKLLPRPIGQLTKIEATNVIDDLRSRLNEEPQQAPSQKPSIPEHIAHLKTAMEKSGVPYTRENSVRWMATIDNYLNETGDSVSVDKLGDLTPEAAVDVIQAIDDETIVFPVDETTEAVAA